jgi:type I restriction enzyme S subunit
MTNQLRKNRDHGGKEALSTGIRRTKICHQWDRLTGRDLASKITKGSSPNWQGFSYQDEGLLFITSENVRDGHLDISNPKFLPAEFGKRARSSQLHSGDILLNIVGASIGRACRFDLVGVEANVNQAVCVIRLKPSSNVEFFLQLIQAPHVQARLLGKRSDSARPNLSLEDIRGFQFDMPPLPEQRKIAEILRTWDEALEKLEALRAAKLQRYAAFAQRLLRFVRPTRPCASAVGWKIRTFGELFTEQQNRNAKLGPESAVTVGKYAIRRSSEHFKKSVVSKDLSNYWVITPGDFVYDPMSAYYGAIGRYKEDGPGIVSPAYRVIRLREDTDPDFMVHVLRTHHVQSLLESRSSQGNKEGKRRLLGREEFASIEVRLPALARQRAIADQLLDFKLDLDLTLQQLAVLSTQKRGLMQKLLTGEWRVSP